MSALSANRGEVDEEQRVARENAHQKRNQGSSLAGRPLPPPRLVLERRRAGLPLPRRLSAEMASGLREPGGLNAHLVGATPSYENRRR